MYTSNLIKTTLCFKNSDNPRAVYLIDGTKINVGFNETGGSFLNIEETPQYGCDNHFHLSNSHQTAINNLWDSITDILTQEQLDKLEKLHNKDLIKLGII